MKTSKILAITITLSLVFAGVVFADAINMNRPYDGMLTPDYPIVWDEPTLDEIFDSNVSGDFDAVSNQSNIGLWTDSEADVDAYSIAMIGGDNGVLGIYSASSGQEIDLAFSGGSAGFKFNTSGAVEVGGTWYSGFGYNFGFYWKNTDYNDFTAYTEDSKNSSGYGDDENILALSYLVPDGHTITVDLGAGGIGEYNSKGNNDWILAFEDRPNGDLWGDHDFNDAVFYVEDIDPVPEPATILLFGAGLLGLAAYGRKRGFRRS